jgi:23S rRNA pseudouridine1911/1915/1917 synthase
MRAGLNQGFVYRTRLDASAAGKTVCEFLAARHPHSSEATWTERFTAGELELDGTRAVGDELGRAGQVLVWRRPPWLEPAVPDDWRVLHEDPAILVVHKPAGLPTAPAGGFLAHTLLALVRRRDPAWSPMHRLGRGTSGLLVFARTPAARRALQAAFRDHAVEKRYLALVQGNLQPQILRTPIGPVAHPRLGSLHAACADGKPCESRVVRCERLDGATLAEVLLVTGRPHQIRIHLAAAGHPVIGDPLYGPGGLPREDSRALPGDGGYHLHAWRLAFTHPATGEPFSIEAPAPLRWTSPALRKVPADP